MVRGAGQKLLSRLLPAGYLLRLPDDKRSLGKHMHAAVSGLLRQLLVLPLQLLLQVLLQSFLQVILLQ